MIDLNYFLLHKTSLVTYLIRAILFGFLTSLSGSTSLDKTFVFRFFDLSILQCSIFQVCQKHANLILANLKSYLPVVLVLKRSWTIYFFLPSLPLSLLVEQYCHLDSALLQVNTSVKFNFFYS